MSINRLLLIAGLLAIGACGHPGPTAICAGEPNVDRDTEELLCTPDRDTPLGIVSTPADEQSVADDED